MKILITGANGFLAQHLTLFLSKKGYQVFALGRGECRIAGDGFTYVQADLVTEDEVRQAIERSQPDVVVHAAAMSKPDECDKNREMCIDVNVNATRYLITACEQLSNKPHFIYTSTDFVFGEGGPHAEDDIPAPLNFYGETKLMAENAVQQSHLDWCIMRPVFIYGVCFPGMRPSFLHMIRSNLEAKKPIKIVNDQFRTPTYVTDLCRGIQCIVEKRFKGLIHLAGKDILSPYQMAIQVAKYLQLDNSFIEEVSAETFWEPVKRAKRSGLKIDKAMKELNYDPISFEEGIAATFKNL